MTDKRLAIDFVSPLPPVRSGIADYSADLLPHLAELCDLRLIRLPGQPVDAEIRQRHPLVSADRLGEDGRLPFYQMGNNQYHAAMPELAFAHPGVLTLHDLALHHLLIEGTLRPPGGNEEGGTRRDDFDAYRQALAEEHGWIGDAAARPRRWPGGWADAALFALPSNRRLLASQRGVLVHSEWAAEWLREDAPGLAVRAVPMGVPPGSVPDADAGLELRRRLGIPEDAPLLGSFGFQTPIKRTGVAIRAMARPEMDGVHLLVAGEVAPVCGLEETALSVGVDGRVHFLGFLPFDRFEAAIAATDVCLNLRYPTAGETSASLLRILAVGKPAVVSEHAQMAELPDDVAVKVPLGDDEEAALARRLAVLLADRGRLRAMGESARRYVLERHDPARAASAMVEACRRFAVAEPLGSVPAAPPPTSFVLSPSRGGGEIHSRVEGDLEVAGAETPWPEGERRRLRIRLVNRSHARWLAGENPDGGVAVEVRVLDGDERPQSDVWLGLPLDLEPGDEHVFELALRRPLGRVRLEVEPHVFGHQGFAGLGGPTWEAWL